MATQQRKAASNPAIYVTDHLIAKHEELLAVFDKLNRAEYSVRTKKRLEVLYAMRKAQNSNPIQLEIPF